MGFLHILTDPIEDLGKTIVHTATHAIEVTVGGVKQTLKVVTDAEGKVQHDVLDAAGKVIIKAGSRIG